MRIKKDHPLLRLMGYQGVKIAMPEYTVNEGYAEGIDDLIVDIAMNVKNKYILTNSFIDSYLSASNSISKSVAKNKLTITDSFIDAFFAKEKAMLLKIDSLPNGDFKAVAIEFLNKIGGLFVSGLIHFDYTASDGVIVFDGFLDDYRANVGDNYSYEHEAYLGLTMICLPLFIKYSEVETKTLLPKSKAKAFNCRYSNLTKEKFTILDSTWLTNLVKSDEFKVRGHFRLQPCGEGLKDRKLIWINEFKKSGYTRKAGLLKQQENGE